MNLLNGAIIFVFCVSSVVYCDINKNDKQEIKDYVKLLIEKYINPTIQVVPDSLIDVPMKCPSGYAVDEHGKCQEMWDSLNTKQNIVIVRNETVPHAVVDVPHKCRPDQNVDDKGKCQEIWNAVRMNIKPEDVSRVLNMCPPGFKSTTNGICKDESNFSNTYSVIDVPDKCPPGQKPDENGKCQEIWDSVLLSKLNKNIFTKQNRNEKIFNPTGVIEVPDKCPPGQKPDENGECQEIWDSILYKIFHENENIISPSGVIEVPDKCPPGFKPDEHGKCQEIWDSVLYKILHEKENIANPNGVIEVPDKCPPGFKPDEHGECQEEWYSKHN